MKFCSQRSVRFRLQMSAAFFSIYWIMVSKAASVPGIQSRLLLLVHIQIRIILSSKCAIPKIQIRNFPTPQQKRIFLLMDWDYRLSRKSARDTMAFTNGKTRAKSFFLPYCFDWIIPPPDKMRLQSIDVVYKI